MKIGELSRRTGISIRMLRYYEAEGLLSPRRRESGYRDYDAEDVDIIDRIKLLSAAGLTLATIQELLPCLRDDLSGFEPCDELRAVLRQQVDSVDSKIERLDRSRDLLARFLRDIEAAVRS